MLNKYGLDIFIQPVWTPKTQFMYKYLNLYPMFQNPR